MLMEAVFGSAGGCLACVFTNPLELVKTRLQLQNELQSKIKTQPVKYRNVFQSLRAIVKDEGFLALQKGLVPVFYYQIAMNGVRLGMFQTADNLSLTRNQNGEITLARTIFVSGICSAISGITGSPFWLIKTQLQTRSIAKDAVGHQHNHLSTRKAFLSIIRVQGLAGLWRGTSASVLRVTVGGTVQLSTFAAIREILKKYEISDKGWLNTLLSATAGGAAISTCIAPFDIIGTRVYNQPIDGKTGKPLLYANVLDCARKIYATEGFLGFYKGWTVSVLKVGPHSVLSLFMWQELRKMYFKDG